MPLGVIQKLDENVINDSLINLSSEAFSLSQCNAGNRNKNAYLKEKQHSKKRDSMYIVDPTFPPNQSKIPHILNKSSPNLLESLPDNCYSVHNKGPYFFTVEPVSRVS